MGRVKLEIKKIENPTNRQVTYSKRRNGLIKKAYELSELCDIDIAVIMFSPSGKLTQFCRDDRIEDVIGRYANTPQHERTKRKFENVEYLNKVVQKLADERGVETQFPRLGLTDHCHLENQELRAKVQKLTSENDFLVRKQQLYQGLDNLLYTPLPDLVVLEQEFERNLTKIRERREFLQSETQFVYRDQPSSSTFREQPSSSTFREPSSSTFREPSSSTFREQSSSSTFRDQPSSSTFREPTSSSTFREPTSSFSSEMVDMPARVGPSPTLLEDQPAGTSADGGQGVSWLHLDNNQAMSQGMPFCYRDSSGIPVYADPGTSFYRERHFMPPGFPQQLPAISPTGSRALGQTLGQDPGVDFDVARNYYNL